MEVKNIPRNGELRGKTKGTRGNLVVRTSSNVKFRTDPCFQSLVRLS